VSGAIRTHLALAHPDRREDRRDPAGALSVLDRPSRRRTASGKLVAHADLWHRAL